MSRRSKPSWWSSSKRSKVGAGGKRGARRLPGLASRRARHLDFENLENRTLLSISASVSNGNTGPIVNFTSLTLSDELYLATSSTGLLEWHDQNTSFSTGLGGATLDLQTLSRAQDVTLDTQIASSDGGGSGGVFLKGISTYGHSLALQGASLGSSNQLLAIQSTVDTQGGDFTAAGFSNVTFGTASGAGVTVSTRNVGGGTDYLAGASQGNSGAVNVTVANPDPNDPFLNIGFNTPQITVDPGSDLLAQATGGNQPGSITLTATNTNNVLDGLSFPMIGDAVRQATVDFADSTTSSASTMVEGGTIDIAATSGDTPLVQTLASGLTDQTSTDQFASWGPWVNGVLDSALQASSLVPGLNVATLPVSVNYRDAASTVTVGQYTQIIGTGNVTVAATSTADAEGQAIYSRGTQFGGAVAFMMGTTDAETNVNSDALIQSTTGSVTVGSTATTTATDTARVSQNGTNPANPNDIAVALAEGVVNQTAKATVSQGATIRAAGNVNLTATGNGGNTSMPTTTTYVSGIAGVAVGVNITENTIKAYDDGTLISGLSSGAAAIASKLTLDPINAVDFANSAFRVPPANINGLQTGQPYVYSSGDNGAIGGLISGDTYSIIVPTNLTNEIQLAATSQDAANGNFIPFPQYPTLTGGSTSVPVSDVDETDGTYQNATAVPPVPISSLTSSPTTTNINYAVPFTPLDIRAPVVTQFGGIDTSVMSFPKPFTASPTTLTPLENPGVNIMATLSDSENSFVASGVGGTPAWQDKILKPELVAPQANTAIFGAGSTIWNTVAPSIPGGTGASPNFSLAGAVFIQDVPVDNVTAEVGGDAVIESAAGVTVAASLTQTVDTGVTAGLTGQDGTAQSTNPGLAGALALGIGHYDPTVHASIDSGAQVDAAGTIAVTATTTVPFEVPTTVNGVEGDILSNPINPSYNLANFVTNFLSDSMLGLGTDIFNNSASAKVDPKDESRTAVGGNIQVFQYSNDTEATIGAASFNQKASDPNALGQGQGISFRSGSQSVTVGASTVYDNAAEAGSLDFSLAPASLVENIRSGNVLDIYGDTKGKNAIGASVFADLLNNQTYATIDSGAKIGIGPTGALNVDADQTIIAVSLVQSGDQGGNVGVAGMVSWYEVTNQTRAQIEDGVTVNGGTGASGNPIQGGAVTVDADDNTILVGVTGGAVKGNHIGVGFAIAVNKLNPNTTALIGSTSTPTKEGSFDISSLAVNATDEGQVGTLSYSAARIVPSEGQVQSNSNPFPWLSRSRRAGLITISSGSQTRSPGRTVSASPAPRRPT